MGCKYLLKRSKNYKPVFYCKLDKRHIDYRIDCENCLKKEYKATKGITTKTNKLKTIEQNRYSILTNKLNECYNCHKHNIKLDLHEVYGGANRIRSMKNGLVVPLCRECHSNEEIISKLRLKCQQEFEKEHTRDEFIQIIGKSYL